LTAGSGKDNRFRFDSVRKEFRTFFPRRQVLALESLTFGIEPGEITGLVGPNGSGKTTAFRLAAGLIRPDAGAISIFGAPAGSNRARNLLGYMPELPGVPGSLTPAELLHFVGRVFGFKPADRERRIGELSELLALAPFLDRRMAEFSKGMVKRTGLAAALFHGPQLLLLDEPLEGIDPLGSAAIKDHVRDLAARGTAVLISSHILTDVETLCGSLLILDRGRVVLSGKRDEILSLRDRVEMRFSVPDEKKAIEEIGGLIGRLGGKVHSTGYPREDLESLFRRLLEKG
jgi:ABC-2 type transport system ATP-binding protein